MNKNTPISPSTMVGRGGYSDNEILLLDRIDKIQAINKQYNLLDNAYISFSGGKDSTVLHYLIDLALPNNKIPRVYINTGIEYKSIVNFVKELAKQDDRIIVVNSGVNIKQMLEDKGYPFKSKEHSLKIGEWQKGSRAKSIVKYKEGINFVCPKILQYQFEDSFKLKLSSECCNELKKKPIKKWQKENHRTISITGMRRAEGGQRSNINCIVTEKEGALLKFHPLSVVNDSFEEWFINEYNIKLCELYYEPYNFIRTGCKGCPYAIELQRELDVMEKFLPNERKQCETIWEPVYDEYRRIGYRLKERKSKNDTK